MQTHSKVLQVDEYKCIKCRADAEPQIYLCSRLGLSVIHVHDTAAGSHLTQARLERATDADFGKTKPTAEPEIADCTILN